MFFFFFLLICYTISKFILLSTTTQGGIGPARKDKERTGTGSVGENNGIILADGSVNINNNDGQVVQVNAPSAADQLLSLKNNVLQALKVEERDLDLRFLDEFCATYGPNVSAFQLDEIAQKVPCIMRVENNASHPMCSLMTQQWWLSCSVVSVFTPATAL